MTNAEYDVKDMSLADEGRSRIDWALNQMPVLQELAKRFKRERPLEGVRVSGCLHITTETANLARVLKAGGADLVLCAAHDILKMVAPTLMHARYQIRTVINRQRWPMSQCAVDVPIVGFSVLATDRECRHIEVAHKGSCHVVLSTQRIRSAEHSVRPG